MGDRIIVLTVAVEGPVLGRGLIALNPALDVVHVETRTDLERAVAAPEGAARLIAFCTSVIIPALVLERLPGRAYNFHPGPPEYRGAHPAVFATHEGARNFGATAHEVVAEVDAGAIVGLERFDVPAGTGREALDALAYGALVRLFHALAPRIARDMRPLAPLEGIAWSGPLRTRADARRLTLAARR